MILELLHVFSGVMRGAIMPLSLDPDGQNFRNYHVWPEASLDQITPWLPQVGILYKAPLNPCHQQIFIVHLTVVSEF